MNLAEEAREKILDKFNRYVTKKGIEPTLCNFFNYLNNNKIIRENTIKKYKIIEMYPSVLQECKGIKEDALFRLEELTGLTYEQVRYIVNKCNKEFL